MKLVTWNINSVRLRIIQVERLTEEAQPDVICLQETNTPDEHFPLDTIHKMGYEYVHFNGMKSYNGVAILSRIPLEDPKIHSRVNREDCRHISAVINGIELHNIYIPAGGDEPDRDINDKFAHKLDFIDEMNSFFKDNYSSSDKVVVVGDFNIAPQEHDVWSHKQLLKVVSHTPIEVEKLGQMQNSLDWVDVSREFIPENEKCYSWWSYRNRDWKKSNRGRRLDHIWVTPPLQNALSNHAIHTDARDWEKPSDHAPVIVEIQD